jgi:hypothetical protein
MRCTARILMLAFLVLAPLGCGGSGAAADEQAACEKLYGGVLQRMRSFMAEVGAGMTVGTFNEEYPTLAGPMQLAQDAAENDNDCPPVIKEKVNELYRRIKSDSRDPSTIQRWNASYEALRSEINALP